MGVLKVGHDLKFAWQIFALRGIEIAAYDDTMLMSYALDAGRASHALDSVAERTFNHAALDINELIKAGKTKITFDAVGIDRATEYAAEKADIVLRLHRVLKPRLAAERVLTVYETLERPLLAVLARMERRGISIDRDVLSRLSGEFAQEAAGLEDEINREAGETVNPGSPKQLGDILFGKLGLPGGTKTKTGQWATGARALEELAEQGHKLPQMILGWRQVSKLKSTYTDALPGLRQSDDTSGPYPVRLGVDHQPAGCRHPIQICRTFRCGPRTAARSAVPSLPLPARSSFPLIIRRSNCAFLLRSVASSRCKKRFAKALISTP